MNITESIPDFGFSTELNEAHKAFGQDLGIIAYVEGYEDVRFWGKEFKKLHLDVNVREISQFSVANGKDSILSAINDKRIILGEKNLICIDSDYDYLWSENIDIYDSPFCFQTYAYSIENYYYNPIGLTELCYDAACISYNSNDKYLDLLFKQWSNYIYNYFLLYLQHKDTNQQKFIVESLEKIRLDTQFTTPIPHNLSSTQLKNFTDKGLSIDNVFLYFRGHDLEKAIKRLAESFIEQLSNQKKEEIKSHHGNNASTFLKEYFNKRKEIKNLAEMRHQYPLNHCYALLQRDIKAYITIII